MNIKQMRFSIFRPVEKPENEFTRLIEKYNKPGMTGDKLKFEVMMDMQKLAANKFDNGNKRVKRFEFYHYFFKPKFFLPLLYWARKKLGKCMPQKREDIPDELYNANVLIIFDAWTKTWEDWNYYFRGGTLRTKEEVMKQAEEGNKNLNNHCYYVPDFFVKYLAMVYLEDTAYREMINCFLFNLQEGMNKRWNPEIKHQFPMYTVLYDQFLPYFCEWLKQNGGGSFTINVDANAPPNPHLDPVLMEQMRKHMEDQNKNAKTQTTSGGSQGDATGTQGNNDGQNGGETSTPGNVQGIVPEQKG
jgi:hypothetical protein